MHTTTGPSVAVRTSKHPTGFTLVEMLVSVTLVLMMMMMFAEVFEIASGIHVKIRGVTRNDQRTRILTRILRSDLDKRTMRHATPFRFGEHTSPGPVDVTTNLASLNLADRDLDNRQGYFSVSENNPQNDLDDVLQFTARTSISLQNIDSTRFTGASNNLANMAEDANNNNQLDPGEDINGNGQLDSGLSLAGFNQPDWDDGVFDNASESIAAEISYFLRNGTLYRRVLLLRQPAYGGDQPTNSAGNPIVPAYANLARPFWYDFDFSAHFDSVLGRPRFHGLDSLDNSGSLAHFPLAIRRHRFGHSHVSGIPREFTPDGHFIGRFTHEETSHPAFIYPRTVDGQNRSPMDGNYQSLGQSPQLNSDGVVTALANGPRRAEDVLMTNVHSFDVKVLRDAFAPWSLPEFRDEDFDTAHPQSIYAPEDQDGDGQLDNGEDQNGNNLLDISTLPLSTLPQAWQRGMLYSFEWDANNNGQLDNNEDQNGNGQFDPIWVRPSGHYRGLWYRSIGRVGQSASTTSGLVEPDWPQKVGQRVIDGSIIWEAAYDRHRALAIQVTIRFLDLHSGHMRQATILHSLVN